MPLPDHALVCLCARIERNGLIAAECDSLTGGIPDADGVARCERVDGVDRAAFAQIGLEVIVGAPSFADLVAAVDRTDFSADGFRIDVHDPSGRLGRSTQEVATALADVIPFGPDLSRPQNRFVVVGAGDAILFTRVVSRTDASYRRHDAKPWTTSSSLDGRFARALVNLVPGARSIVDPCCGAGSIVLESASLAVDTYGVDVKPAMVGMTRENLAHFGYVATVVKADSRIRVPAADAVVTDLPYGHAIEADETSIRAILERGAESAAVGVYVAPADITVWLRSAGYSEISVCSVRKRAGFTRWVHVARRA